MQCRNVDAMESDLLDSSQARAGDGQLLHEAQLFLTNLPKTAESFFRKT